LSGTILKNYFHEILSKIDNYYQGNVNFFETEYRSENELGTVVYKLHKPSNLTGIFFG